MGKLISFNNFLSTTIQLENALGFVQSYVENSDLKAVLFKIDLQFMNADGIPTHTPFASINDYSEMKWEDEVLFSMHAVFRISSVNEAHNGIGHIELKLANDDDEEIRALTEYFHQDIGKRSKGLYQLCILMDKMGEVDTAIEIGQVVLTETPETSVKERANIYNDLGRLCTSAGSYTKALQYYTDMYNIILKHYPDPSENELACALIHANMAHVIHLQANEEDDQRRIEKYKGALKYYKPFIHLESLVDVDDFDDDTLQACAINFNNIGLLYHDMEHKNWSYADDYSKTLAMFEKALSFYQRLPMPNAHPYIAILLNNIALIECKKMNVQNALKRLQACLTIQERTLVSDHSLFANTYFNLSNCYILQGMIDNAKQHAERAAQIARQCSDPNLSEYEQLIHEIDFIKSRHPDCNTVEYKNLLNEVVDRIRSTKLQ